MTTHGETRKSKENRAWHLMMQRCGDPNIPRHADYGGRGIRVCERWRDSYECFLSDVGRAPSPSHSMDRFPDVNGNYEPGNVRWATDSEQARNKRDTRWVEFRGKQVCLQEVSEKTGVSPKVILLRMSKGMTADEASSFSARKAKLYDINGEKLNMDQLVLIYGVPKTTFHRYIDASKGDINTAIAKLQEKRKTQ